MVRILGILVGLGFVLAAGWSFGKGAATYLGSPREQTAEQRYHEEPRDIAYSFDGPFGHYDRREVQRGFFVFQEVCSACHSLQYVAFRDLRQLGYSEAEVRAIADRWRIQVPSVNPQTGEATTRKAIPADHFPSPFPNEVAARAANNNALPPDLSLMAKAREGGPAYIESLITGYANPPAGYQVPPNLHYNPYFANLNLAMPPPLTADGQVTYADGTRATRGQMAHDVAAFLAWAAEPRLGERHDAGIAVLVFLTIATILAYMAYQNVWHGPRRREEDVAA
jgi:ubiquinol-cytochrome c reductase cytochrome c1 subunit